MNLIKRIRRSLPYRMRIAFLAILLSVVSTGFSQSNTVTDFKENNSTALSLYFYPSTLRMINLDRNREFDEMIREIKKARFFKMDSGSVSLKELAHLGNELKQEGFEEVMFMKSKNMDLRVWGLYRKNPALVIVSKSADELMLLEINGMINIAKIPKLAETFNKNGFLDVLNLNEKKN